MLGAGDGTLSSNGAFAVGGSPEGVASGDFNEDGAIDLAFTNRTDDTVAVLLANPVRVTTTPYLNFMSQESARNAIPQLKGTLERITTEVGAIGAIESRLGTALQVLSAARNNFQAAESRIRDADIAEESSRLTRLNILQQAALSGFFSI